MSLIPVCIKRRPTVICCAMRKRETQNIYRTLTSKNLSLEHPYQLSKQSEREIGYQVGTRLWWGSPNQTKRRFGQGFIVYKRILSTDGWESVRLFLTMTRRLRMKPWVRWK